MNLFQQSIPEPSFGTDELVARVVQEYKFMVKTVGPDKFVNLVCWVGGREIDVYSIGKFGDFLSILGKSEDGTELRIFAPVELVSFSIILRKNPTQTPPPPAREIGFHTELSPAAQE
jgi:hypothetical protein